MLGRTTGAVAMPERAQAILHKHDLGLLVAAAMRRFGELEGPSGVGRIEEADRLMRSESVARPDRMTAMYLPGLWHGHG
jgi:hypothetical protein